MCIHKQSFLFVPSQTDMRDFLNAPNGSANPSLVGNEKREADPSQSPLGGKTVCINLRQSNISCL